MTATSALAMPLVGLEDLIVDCDEFKNRVAASSELTVDPRDRVYYSYRFIDEIRTRPFAVIDFPDNTVGAVQSHDGDAPDFDWHGTLEMILSDISEGSHKDQSIDINEWMGNLVSEMIGKFGTTKPAGGSTYWHFNRRCGVPMPPTRTSLTDRENHETEDYWIGRFTFTWGTS